MVLKQNLLVLEIISLSHHLKPLILQIPKHELNSYLYSSAEFCEFISCSTAISGTHDVCVMIFSCLGTWVLQFTTAKRNIVYWKQGVCLSRTTGSFCNNTLGI